MINLEREMTKNKKVRLETSQTDFFISVSKLNRHRKQLCIWFLRLHS